MNWTGRPKCSRRTRSVPPEAHDVPLVCHRRSSRSMVRAAPRSKKPRRGGVCLQVGDPGLEPGTSSLSGGESLPHGPSQKRLLAGKTLAREATAGEWDLPPIPPVSGRFGTSLGPDPTDGWRSSVRAAQDPVAASWIADAGPYAVALGDLGFGAWQAQQKLQHDRALGPGSGGWWQGRRRECSCQAIAIAKPAPRRPAGRRSDERKPAVDADSGSVALGSVRGSAVATWGTPSIGAGLGEPYGDPGSRRSRTR
jgi:hypothetical protein